MNQLYLQHFGELGLEIEKMISDNLFKVGDGRNSYLLKFLAVPDQTRLEWKLANWKLAGQISGEYQYLIIPRVYHMKKLSATLGVVMTEWFEGESFNTRWSEFDQESQGGALLPKSKANLVLDLIQDLKDIDLKNLELIRPTFNIEDSGLLFDRVTQKALKRNLIDSHDLELAREYCDLSQTGIFRNIVLSNGDFQYRNFIETGDNKVAIVDWDGIQASRVEAERCASYQYILMWNNQSWQKYFLHIAIHRYGLQAEILQYFILLNSLMQALHWVEYPSLSKAQVFLFRKTLLNTVN